ncbi:MAG: NADH-quinone oxidoreductase subunit F, partial [Anaerolineae bacterium]|nr:NADH-quinone oxidoreductase subunit F [Anaerolineae bacterium]
MAEKILLRNVGVPNSHTIEVYLQRGGYQALAKALKEYTPQQLVELVKASGLRGRGGAGVPTRGKMRFPPAELFPRYQV